jgi:hypothetical protein
MEQALSSILDYLEPQNSNISHNRISEFLSLGSFPKESNMPRVGFGTATKGDITRKTSPFFD